jgi:hypothetical protein
MKRIKVTETPVDLLLWRGDGAVGTGNGLKARRVPFPKVSVGRTDSKRRLGFAVKMTARSRWVLFTLDRVQVANLHDHLAYQLQRLGGGTHVRSAD